MNTEPAPSGVQVHLNLQTVPSGVQVHNLRRWLDATYNPKAPTDEHVSNLARFAELVGVNLSFDVRGWGVTASGGVYGRTGLNQEEALELITFRGILEGFGIALGREAFQAVVDEIVYKIRGDEIQHEEDARCLAEMLAAVPSSGQPVPG